MALQRIPIHRSGNRANLFMGGDRELVMFSGVLAAVMIFSAFSRTAWGMIVVGIVFWLVALSILRLMAKSDPLLRKIYQRHLLYEKYYPPRSTPFRVNTEKQQKRYRGMPPQKELF